jgi:hypothetical protein
MPWRNNKTYQGLVWGQITKGISQDVDAVLTNGIVVDFGQALIRN